MAKPEPTLTVGGFVIKSCPLTPMTNAEMLAQLSLVSGHQVQPDQKGASIQNAEPGSEDYSGTHNIDMAYARACNGRCADCGATPDECVKHPCPHHQSD